MTIGKAEDDKLTKFVAGLVTMAEEHQKSMDRMSKDDALACVKDIFATSDVVFGVWIDPEHAQSSGTVPLKGGARFREAVASNRLTKLRISAVRCTFELAADVQHRFEADRERNTPERWNALVKYDDEIRAAADKLRPFGDDWVNELAQAYYALNEDRKYLANIVNRLLEEAERHLPTVIGRLVEEAQRGKEQRWANRFRRTANGELCTEESLRILRQAEAQGYFLDVEKDNTLTANKNGTLYLRSNADIERFGRSIVSFRKPMNFPKGTTVYRTKGPRVAVLPDYSLIVDGGGIGGRVFESASDYRVLTGDQEDWEVIQNF